jgi:hypothetical protein
VTLDAVGGNCKSEVPKKMEIETERTNPIDTMIEIQIKKIDETLTFLEEYEKLLTQERLQLNDV